MDNPFYVCKAYWKFLDKCVWDLLYLRVLRHLRDPRDPLRDPLRDPRDPPRDPRDPLRDPRDPLRDPRDPPRDPRDPPRDPNKGKTQCFCKFYAFYFLFLNNFIHFAT